VPASRRTLAVYPVMLMYVFLGWLAVARSTGASGGGAAVAPPPAAMSPPPPPTPSAF
jgi:hypothetical protein